ncbi:deoxynucleotide monophosphate kinase [Pseudomonas fluorescens]|uniref:deoxynucleotide monophosphate kinase family protein n=1 Tax=Pseudomonas fluorescens TaxID=294 RepID=UPI003D21C987
MPTIIGLAAIARSGKDTVASMLLEHGDVAAYALADPLKLGCQSLFGLTDEETWSDDLKEKQIPLWGMSPRQMFQRVGTEFLRDHNPDHWLLRADRHLNHPKPESRLPSTRELDQPSSSIGTAVESIWLAVQSIWGLSHQQTFETKSRDISDPYWSLTPNEMYSVLEHYLRKYFPNYEEVRNKLPLQLPTRSLTPTEGKSKFIIKDIRFENEADFWRSHNGVIWHIIRHNATKVNAHTSEAGIKVQQGDTIIENNGTLEELRLKVDLAWTNIHS